MTPRFPASFARAAALVILLTASSARAGGFSLNVGGELLNTFSPTTCGSQLGDAYDDFCPSGACRCEEYEGKLTGNVVGSASDVTLHLTVDQGNHTSSPGCSPVFGELHFTGSLDVETIYLNGSYCDPLGNSNKPGARMLLQGGFGIAASSHGLAGFGTASGKFGFNNTNFTLKLTGQAQ